MSAPIAVRLPCLAATLLVLVIVLAVDASTLFLLDCGPHADLMRDFIREERYAGALVFYNTALSDPPECHQQHPLEELFWWILWTPDLAPPVRVSLSLGIYNTSHFSFALGELVRRGFEVFAAAGNEGTDLCSWPASQQGVTAVTYPGGNRCAGKTPLLNVSGVCSTSEATARSAARGANTSWARTPASRCESDPYPWQWSFAGIISGVFGAFLVAMLALYLWRRWRSRCTGSTTTSSSAAPTVPPV